MTVEFRADGLAWVEAVCGAGQCVGAEVGADDRWV